MDLEFDDIKKYLTNILVENNIDTNDTIFNKFEKYFQILVEYNKNVNLTAITERNEVYIKHFCDCLLGIKQYKIGSTVCDIGTGAGFPGVVLKIARPDLNVVLVDSLNKRVDFLNYVINELKLDNIFALHYRAEDKEFKDKYLNSFDYVVSRAVANMCTLTEYCLPYVKIGGEFVSYKSSNCNDELREASKCIAELGGKLHKVDKFILNDEFERNIVVIEKIRQTSNKYPRGGNKPRLTPIK